MTRHQYLRAGSFVVGLTVCDSSCVHKATLKISLVVLGALNTQIAESPQTLYYNDQAVLTGTVSNGTRTSRGTYNYTFKWDFGDGAPAISQQVITPSLPAMSTIAHRIRASADVTFSLSINDTFGQTGAASQTIRVGGLLGFDCGYGSNEVTTNSTGFPGPDGVDQHGNAISPTLDSSCTWAGSPDIPSGGTQLQPLVSDNPTITIGPGCCSTPSRGGGFTVELVYVQGGASLLNAYDMTLSWDPKVLNAVEFDQGGLPFSPSPNVYTAVSGINNTRGSAELSQTLIGTNVFGNVTLFRIRFDVIGIGSTGLTISNELLTDSSITPPALPHKTVQGDFVSANIPDLLSGGVALGYTVSWTYAPIPIIPGSPITLTATATCSGCSGTLSYKWDVDSVQGYPDPSAPRATIEALGNQATITLPTAILLGDRVTLIVNDTAGHAAESTRLLPLTLSASPSGASVTVGTPVSITAHWLGGIPPYSGTTGQVGVKWLLCNTTGTSQMICTNPNPSTSNQPGQINTIFNTYKWAGVFTGTVAVTDTLVPQIPSGPTSVSTSFQVNVTGAPQAFTVAVTTNGTLGSIARNNIMVNATVAYNSAYPLPYRSSLFTYTFIFGDGNTTIVQRRGTAISIFHNFTSPASYSIIVVAQEVGSNAFAKIQERASSQVTILNPVSGSFTIPSGTITSGQSVTFTATGTGGQPPYAYTWDFGDGATGTGVSTTHSYAGSGTYTVKLTVTDSQGRSFVTTQTVTVATSLTFYLEIGAGIAVAAVSAVAVLLFLRRRQKVPIASIPNSTTKLSPK